MASQDFFLVDFFFEIFCFDWFLLILNFISPAISFFHRVKDNLPNKKYMFVRHKDSIYAILAECS